MTPVDDLSRFCCQNHDCPDYGQRGLGNLRVASRYGAHQRRMLACRTCKARFSERKGTPYFGARLPDEKVTSLLEHLDDGCGVRHVRVRPQRRHHGRSGQARHLHGGLAAGHRVAGRDHGQCRLRSGA